MRSGAVRIALIYVAIALLWITLSDRLLYIFHDTLTPKAYMFIGSLKGYFFVVVYGFVLYKLIRIEETKLGETSQQSMQANNEVQRLGNIITKVSNLIIITDQNNFITWVNKAFEDFTGYAFDEVAGYTPATFFITGDTEPGLLNTILKKKRALEAFSAQVNCRKKCGDPFWVKGEYTPLFDDNNKFTGYIAVYNDISKLKQKELETTRQNEKLREVAWLCSHEIRRPVANIMGLICVMRTTPHLEDKVKIIDDINQSAEELDKIIHAMNSTIGAELEAVETK